MRVLIELFLLPQKWHKRLSYISVPLLFNEIEEDIKRLPAIKWPPILLIILVKYRVKNASKWKKNRCLLQCMLLTYFLSRAGFQITIHLGCNLLNDNFYGHCWISSPQLTKYACFQDLNKIKMQEIYFKKFIVERN